MPITLEDIGYNKVLTKDYPLADLDLVNNTYQDSLLGTSPKTQSSWWDGITPEILGSGFLSANVSLIDGYLMSANYIENQAGWKVDAEGDLYANSGIFRGKLVAGEIHIPDETTVNSFHTNKYGDSWWGCTEANFNANVENAVAYILRNGTGKLADWYIKNNFIGSSQDYDSSEIILDAVNSIIRAGKSNEDNIIIDGGNSLIRSSNYTSGTSGFLISPDLIEAENLYARGKLSSVVFEYNVQQAVGGQLVVSSSDKLAEDMTADDNSTLTIDGDITFSVNDILRIKDADDDEFMRVQSRNENIYTVQRDLAGTYSSNQNPAWKKGTAVVMLGNSNGTDTFSGGWLEMLGSGLNSPYYSIIKRTGVNYNAFQQIARFGNLKGFLDYTTDEYGIAIGDSSQHFSYDPANGMQFYSNLANAITIDYGGDILLKEGGDIKFTTVAAPEACTATLIETSTGDLDNGTYSYKITYVTLSGETNLGTASNQVTVDDTHKQVSLTNIPCSPSGAVTKRKIYRTEADGNLYYLLATINDNITTTYIDNVADSSLDTDEADYRENNSFGKIFIDNIQVLSCGKNLFLGYSAGYSNTTGNWNTFLGYGAGYSNTTGSNNLFIGYDAGYNNTTGMNNLFIGDNAGYSNTTGYYNVFIGDNVAPNNTTGKENLFLGTWVGHWNTTGNDNIFLGWNAGYNNTTGSNNLFLGIWAGYNNTTGFSNLSLGYNAGYNNTTGFSNLSLGYNAGYRNTSGYGNLFLGYDAGYSNTTGNYNLFMGTSAGYSNTTGSNNICLGYNAGYYETDSNKLFIDNQRRANETDARIKALIYGEFSDTPANQLIRFNSKVEMPLFDGWSPVFDETWTYASSKTITTPGDKTSKYSKGMKVRFVQTTTKYFIVIGVSYDSGTSKTTLTLYGGQAYTVANAAISSPYYSTVEIPYGWPFKDEFIIDEFAGKKLFRATITSASTKDLVYISPVGSAVVGIKVEARVRYGRYNGAYLTSELLLAYGYFNGSTWASSVGRVALASLTAATANALVFNTISGNDRKITLNLNEINSTYNIEVNVAYYANSGTAIWGFYQ